MSLERRTSRAGKDSVDHGPGAHDDLANAAAGTLVLVKQPMGWRPVLDTEREAEAEETPL